MGCVVTTASGRSRATISIKRFSAQVDISEQ